MKSLFLLVTMMTVSIAVHAGGNEGILGTTGFLAQQITDDVYLDNGGQTIILNSNNLNIIPGGLILPPPPFPIDGPVTPGGSDGGIVNPLDFTHKTAEQYLENYLSESEQVSLPSVASNHFGMKLPFNMLVPSQPTAIRSIQFIQDGGSQVSVKINHSEYSILISNDEIENSSKLGEALEQSATTGDWVDLN